MQTIYLCRHGETSWSHSGKHTSFTDLELTENGMCQASTLHPKLKHLSFTQTLISPLKRAQQTAERAKILGELEQDLLEWNYGDYEGLTTEQIQAIEPNWNIFTHGARGGESIEDVGQRADRLIEKIRKYKGNLALFSSGHFTRVLAARWIGAPVDIGKHLKLSTASVSVLGYEHDYPVIQCWNDTSHYVDLGESHGKCAA